MSALSAFRDSLATQTIIDDLRHGLIGEGMAFETPFGVRPLLYADYVASGRALQQVEQFVCKHVLPFYANSHTEASFCGETMTRMREEARATIGRLVNADDDCSVVFVGSGATAGINRIVGLLQIVERTSRGERVVVLSGPYEHHSNILPWRESGADLLTIPEGAGGGADLQHLEEALRQAADADLIVGTFSAASNVTGIIEDCDAVTRLLKRHGALAIWDYAGGGPYLEMDMRPSADCSKDAIVFSPHKFPGGPGASGVMVVRKSIVQRETPTAPGGGTVSFVSPWRHAYSDRIEVREEGGTPNVVGDIRAALVMLVKDAIGCTSIMDRDIQLRRYAMERWSKYPQIEILGRHDYDKALPIFSFMVRDSKGNTIHQQLFTRMLSDMYGIQARGGCACAGPYAHALLGIEKSASEALFDRLRSGHELEKPGWVRLNFSYLLSDEQVQTILEAVATLAQTAEQWIYRYECDTATARFRLAENPVLEEPLFADAV